MAQDGLVEAVVEIQLNPIGCVRLQLEDVRGKLIVGRSGSVQAHHLRRRRRLVGPSRRTAQQGQKDDDRNEEDETTHGCSFCFGRPIWISVVSHWPVTYGAKNFQRLVNAPITMTRAAASRRSQPSSVRRSIPLKTRMRRARRRR